jgi:hypothetical protein
LKTTKLSISAKGLDEDSFINSLEITTFLIVLFPLDEDSVKL